MIKAIVFDYGGVMTDGGAGNELTERFAAFQGVPFEKAKELVSEPWVDFMSGKITEDQYWRRVENIYGQPIDIDKRKIWNTWEDMGPRQAMLEYVKMLKSKDYIVGLLSNVIPVTEAIIREKGIYDLFDPCILSCHVGLLKPDKAIYEELLRQLPGIKPEEIVFVDDQVHNLTPAQEMGIHTVLAKSSMQIIDDVNTLLG
jgi:epoxide hydrolase-like predicted phosphatase